MRRIIVWLGVLSAHCTLLTGSFNPKCGDGFKNKEEECDDGNTSDSDSCVADCKIALCGDSFLQSNEEECDDGNTTDEDGCSASCQFEFECGDGIVETGEECDDGNKDNNDACLNSCQTASCGDGFIEENEEGCDDGNTGSGDGCSIACQIEGNFVCTGEPSVCVDPSLCGNNAVDLQNGEECDDGNADEFSCKSDCTFPNIEQLETGTAHTCALDEFGKIHCWGISNFGQTGYSDTATIGDNEFPNDLGAVPLPGFASQVVTDISIGADHSCGRLDDAQVFCWGKGENGRLGNGNTDNIGDDESAADGGLADLGGVLIAQITAGGGHSCVLLNDDSEMICWGRNNAGQLGIGDTQERSDPFLLSPIDFGNGINISQITLGDEHTCIRTVNNKVRCWGKGADGQLGNKNIDNIGDDGGEIQLIQDLSFDQNNNTASQLTSGKDHNCVVLSNSKLHCWGKNADGQLGLGHSNNIGDDEALLLVSQVPVGDSILAITAGDAHTCALLSTGEAKCWGRNIEGQLGDPDIAGNFGDELLEHPEGLSPISFGNDAIIQISAGGNHSCVLLSSGSVRCWGDGSSGQLGNASSANVRDPAGVSNIPIF